MTTLYHWMVTTCRDRAQIDDYLPHIIHDIPYYYYKLIRTRLRGFHLTLILNAQGELYTHTRRYNSISIRHIHETEFSISTASRYKIIASLHVIILARNAKPDLDSILYIILIINVYAYYYYYVCI